MATSLRMAGVELLILLHGGELISAERFTWSSSFLVEHLLVLTTSSWMVSKACVKAATLVSNLCTLNLELEGGHLEPGTALHFFLYQQPVSGFHWGGGGWNFHPQAQSTHPEILKLSMVLSQVNNNLVPDCNMRDLNSKFPGGGHAPRPP